MKLLSLKWGFVELYEQSGPSPGLLAAVVQRNATLYRWLRLHLFQSLSRPLCHEQKLSKKTRVLFKLHWKLARRSMTTVQLLIEYNLRYQLLTKQIFRNKSKTDRSKRQGLAIWKVNTLFETYLQVNNRWSQMSKDHKQKNSDTTCTLHQVNEKISQNMSGQLLARMFWLVWATIAFFFFKLLLLIRILSHAHRHVLFGNRPTGRSELKRQPVYYEGAQSDCFDHVQNYI